MKKQLAIRVILAALALAIVSCSEDPQAPPPVTTESEYKSLENKDDVLFNIEVSLNKMNYSEYEKTLAEDFVFYFSESDINDGLVSWGEWERADELAAIAGMFDAESPRPKLVNAVATIEDMTLGRIKTFYHPGFDNPLPKADLIRVELTYLDGDENWEEMAAPTSQETYFGKTVVYNAMIVVGSHTFLSVDVPMHVVVRFNDEAGIWQVAAIYDGATAASPFTRLKSRDDVLTNFALALSKRDLRQYAKMLAGDFEFFFSQSDIDDGLVGFSSWDRPEELSAIAEMFSGNAPASRSGATSSTRESTFGAVKSIYRAGDGSGVAPVDGIDFALRYVPGDDNWLVEKGTPGNHPDEDWYFRTVSYNMIVNAGEDEFLATDTDMSIIVRFNPDARMWQIIAIRDDI